VLLGRVGGGIVFEQRLKGYERAMLIYKIPAYPIGSSTFDRPVAAGMKASDEHWR
jgi:hypothetical protein